MTTKPPKLCPWCRKPLAGSLIVHPGPCAINWEAKRAGRMTPHTKQTISRHLREIAKADPTFAYLKKRLRDWGVVA